MKFKSIKNLTEDVKKWSERIDVDYDYIVGIPDSGELVARLLCSYTNKPHRQLTHFADGPCLVVDDSLLSGNTMSLAKRRLPGAKYGAVYVKPGMEERLDTYYESLPRPRVFEWNVFKHGRLPQFMIDIDGILCRDPTKRENDYGERIREFYLTVKPKIIPRGTVGWLVTCRLERYREETEWWLELHSVAYNNLVMRKSRKQKHGVYKAEVYKNSKAILFIESSLKQARVIAKLSGKPVLCYETMEML